MPIPPRPSSRKSSKSPRRNPEVPSLKGGGMADADLREQFSDDVTGDVGQAEVAALKAECEPRVFETEQVQDGGLHVVDMDAVLDRRKSELIGDTQVQARLD